MTNFLPPPGSVAFCYGRFSSDAQNPRSADDQNRGNLDFCARQRWKVAGVFKDEALSGRSTKKRQGYYDLMAAAEAGGCQVIVMEDLSRFGRDAAELHIAARKLKEAGVVICTPSGGVISGLELAIRAQMAQEYSQDLALRVTRGHNSAAREGRVMGSAAYGYRVLGGPDEEGRLRVIDRDEAVIIVRICEDYAAGVSTTAICVALNKEGVPGPGGKLWRPRALTGNKHLLTGILRNPLYIGKLIHGKSHSKFISSTGQVKVTAAPSSRHVTADVPHLRIVTDELWHAVQDKLLARSDPAPNRTRHATYLLSGLVVCGCCDQSFSVVGVSMGCSGRRLGVECPNRRRIMREDLERAVLDGLKERMLQPHILELYLDEYRQEASKAAVEHATRTRSTEKRKQELDRDIANVFAQARSGATGHAAELLNEELERLGAQRKQFEREARSAPPESSLSLASEAVVERLKVLLDDLGAALNGPQRDAARAREIVRSFITQVKVTPLEAEGKPDGRGAGPVRVTVEGSLTKLLGQAAIDWKIQRRRSNAATLDLPNVMFKYYIDIANKSQDWIRASPDLAVLTRLLDDAYIPLSLNAFVTALTDVGRDPGEEERRELERRARRAIARLKNSDLIRSVRLSYGYAGWVWSNLPITDREWQERAKQPQQPAKPLGIMRVTAPEAHVVIITPPTAV